jgi:hypothetical protein
MSYNGSGTFQINTSGQPVVTGTVISSSAFNALTADLATGLSTAITKDGQTATTVRIPFAQGINSSLATDTTSTTTGSIITAGGIGIAKALYVGSATDSSSTTTGSIITAGGIGAAKALWVGGLANIAGALNVGGTATFSVSPVFSALTASSAVATDASKNLVSVTNTGTGSNVLATSPTLTSPTLASANITTALTLTSAAGTVGQALTSQGAGVAPIWATISGDTVGFKNRIINGAMVIDQRNAGASQTFTAAAALAYAVDRWYGYCTGANVTGQQIAGGTTPTVTQNRYRFTGAASVTAVGFGQRIEQKNSYDLAGSTCTLSADLAISATLTTVTWTAYYATTTADTFGSLASPTVTQIATGTFTVSATVTNFSTNISVPAAATTGIQIVFTVGALTAGLTWTIGNVQLEKGSTATSFDYRSIGTEFALCQRYFEMSYNLGTVPASANTTQLRFLSWAINGNNGGFGAITFQVAKRAAPTVTTYDGAGTVNNVSTSNAGANPAFTNGYGYQGAPGNISTSGFVHWGQGAVGNVNNYIHFIASAEL